MSPQKTVRRALSLVASSCLCATAFAQTAPASVAPRRIYIANDDHTDYMWSADADTYDQVFIDLLDFHLALADRTDGAPSEFRARFNTDGSHWLWNYERKKSPAEFARLIARIKDGTIGSPLNTLVSCYGGQPVEAVLRGMYYAGRLERRHDLRFRLANATENQTLPLGLASLFAGSGADYTWRGICACASKLDKAALGARDREVYWYAGHDAQRQLMKWYSVGPNYIGTYLEANDPAASIKFLETNPGFLARHVDPVSNKPYTVLGAFGFGGDDLARKTGVEPPPAIPAVPGLQKVPSSPYCEHFHEIARDLTTPERQVIVSNELDYFLDFEKNHGATLDTHTVTYGNEWDLYSASMSETSARAKRAVEKLRAAELLALLVSREYPAFMGNHVGARDAAFQDLGLYWEHDWTADGPVTRGQRAAWQEKLVANIEYYVESLHAEGLLRLGGMIARPDKKSHRIFVLNPLGWPRTDFADYRYTGSENIHVTDLVTGLDVPHQFIRVKGARFLRIQAPDVPSAGYKVFEIRPGAGSAPTDLAATADAATGTLENTFVRLRVERDGALGGLIDKRRAATELAATIGDLKVNDLAPASDAGEPLRIVNGGPVSVTVLARSEAGLDHTTAVTLYRDSDRVDIHNEITQNFSDVRHWAFGFDLPSPSVHTEEVGAINLDKTVAEGGDYADRNARYDHITVNHFADLSAGDGSRGITISNPDLAFARLGASTTTRLDTATPQLNLLAGGQVDGRWLGIQDQNGNDRFTQRFALRAHGGYDPVAAMRFALEHQNPLVAGQVIADGPAGPYPETGYSLLSVDNPSVLLWALKPAEEGLDRGVIARLWNVSDAPAAASIRLAAGATSAHRATHIETDLEPVALAPDSSVPASFARQQIQTYRIVPR